MANLKWGITQPNAVLEDVEHVFYRTPSYKDGEGGNMFVTQLVEEKCTIFTV